MNLRSLWSLIVQLAEDLIEKYAPGELQKPTEAPKAAPTPETPPENPAPPMEAPRYQWDTPQAARHSVRVICDEQGLTLEEKNTMCATVHAESGFKLTAKYENIINGEVWSTDWGICQINDHYHIGKDKDFPNVDYVLAHPEHCVRWMARLWKAGKRNLWAAYKNGSYKKYL